MKLNDIDKEFVEALLKLYSFEEVFNSSILITEPVSELEFSMDEAKKIDVQVRQYCLHNQLF